MEIANGLEMLELDVELGMPVIINPTLVWDDSAVVLIDSTAPGFGQVLFAAISAAGFDYRQISHMLFTHHDGDHVGEIGRIVEEAAGVKVMASAGEKPYIQGDLPPIKMTPERKIEMDKMVSELPEEKRREMQQAFARTTTPVDEIVTDGEVLPFCGGIEVVETPGHTPGHTCYYLQKYKILVAGDALNVIDGKLAGPKAIFTDNMSLAIKSLEKLLNYDIEAVICHHGGLCRSEIKQQIKTLVAEYH
jgi:glyoxylase-like metal-dependent hydrolase (beta-lactamase superfamily II)